MRILLDTNVLIAAFITRGVCSELLEHCFRQHTLIESEFIFGEFTRHLLRKFKFDEEDVEEAIVLLRSRSQLVQPIALEVQVSRDADDDQVLATARTGRVECIITGDKDLLALGQFEGIDILSPSDFSAYEASKKLS